MTGSTRDNEESENAEAQQLVGTSGMLLRRILILLFVDLVGVLCLAARTPANQSFIDFFLYTAVGGVAAYFAFRAVFFYPFRFPELLAIVVVLSLGLRGTLLWLQSISYTGIINFNPDDPARTGKTFLVCLIVGSVLLTGAALGLRHCYYLKLQSLRWRLLSILCGMVALPAAAGTAAFPVSIAYELLVEYDRLDSTSGIGAIVLLGLLWLSCMAISGVNISYAIKTMTLSAQIGGRAAELGRERHV